MKGNILLAISPRYYVFSGVFAKQTSGEKTPVKNDFEILLPEDEVTLLKPILHVILTLPFKKVFKFAIYKKENPSEETGDTDNTVITNLPPTGKLVEMKKRA